VSIKKTLLSEEPFGIRAMERFNVGDLVRWTELKAESRDERDEVGVIFDLYLKKRGTREVALAKIHVVKNNKNRLSLLGEEKEILVVNLELLSKGGLENE